MKRRYVMMGVAVLLLGVLNFWQWFAPGKNSDKHGRQDRAAVAPSGSFRPEDFQLAIGSAVTDTARVSRNLFQPYRPPAPAVKKVEAPPAPPPKTPEQLAEEAARAELAQIRLIGVVFRGNKGQAYFVKGDQTYMVQTGEKVGDRFLVEGIRPESVQLKDPATQVSGQIQVSGK